MTDYETVKQGMECCDARPMETVIHHDERLRLAHNALDRLEARLAKAEGALREIAGSHRTFGSAQADVRGQHCLDLEHIATAYFAAAPTEEGTR